MCAQKLTGASLIYCTEPETKTKKKRTKNKNGYRVCSEETMPGQKTWSQSGGGEGSLGWKGFVKQVGFEPGVKKQRSDRW